MTAPASRIYVGLDCGGSSSRVLAVDEAGEILFQGQSGAANLISTPESRLRRNLKHASEGCPPPTIACGCFAGLIDAAMRERALSFLGELFPIARLRAEPDYTAALFAADEADVCVVAGTGSLVCSFEDDAIVKSGGRGYILGDEGSGFVFGRDALRHFLRHPQSVTPTMHRVLTEQFGSLVESDVITAVHRAPSPASILAKLVKPLAQDAAAGLPYAIESLTRGMDDLAEVTAAHILRYRGLEKTAVEVALSGGVWKASPLYRLAFVTGLESRLPGRTLQVRRITDPPVIGAVRLARASLPSSHGH